MTALAEPPPPSALVGTPTARGTPTEPPASEGRLWDAFGHGDPDAVAEMYRRHGDVSYAVAHTITGDRQRAAHAVVEAFVLVRTIAAARRIQRPLRIEVLDASRRRAGGLTVTALPSTHRGRASDLYRSIPSDQRDVLALAIAGHCGCLEIAAIMGVDQAQVRRDLRIGLDRAAGLVDQTPSVSSTASTNGADGR